MKKIYLLPFLISALGAFSQTTNVGENSGTGGTANSFFGANAGTYTTGNLNVFMGYVAGHRNTTGHSNTFSGYAAGYLNTTGFENTFIGRNSGYSNIDGIRNTFLGYGSGYKNTTGKYNTFSGYAAGYLNTTGYENTFIGLSSGYYNTTGNRNTFLGYVSGYKNDTGKYNIFLGWGSGHDTTNGMANTYVGYASGYKNTTGMGNVFIGNTAGYYETASNRLYIENSTTSAPLIYGKFDTDQVGINTANIPTGFTFAVKGKMIGEEVKVAIEGGSAWPDYVFMDTYNLPTLSEVANHIKENGHLKDIPSAVEVAENGILLGEMNAKLLQKIEELTLYTIEQEKAINEQQDKNSELEIRLQKLEKLYSTIK